MISKKVLNVHPVPELLSKCKRNAHKIVKAERTSIQDEDILILYAYTRELQTYRIFLTRKDYLSQCIDTGKWYTGSIERTMTSYGLKVSPRCEALICNVLEEWGTPRPETKRWYESIAVMHIVVFQDKIKQERYENRIKKEADMIDKELAEFPKEPKNLYGFLYKKVYSNDNYLFYNKAKKSAYCTHCEADVPFAGIKGTIKHMGEGTCPVCRKPVTFRSSSMSHKYLVSYGTGVVLQRNGRTLYIRYYDTYKNFRDYKYPVFEYREVVRTIIRDGEITNYEWVLFCGGSYRWKKCKPTIENGGINYGVKYVSNTNHAFYSLNVKGTECEYSALKEYVNNSSKKSAYLPEIYLEKWFLNKSLEKLVKVGFYKLVDAVITCDYYITGTDKNGIRFAKLNENEKELHKILGITRDQYKILAEHGNPTVSFYLTVAANKSKNRYSLDDYLFVDEYAGWQREHFFEVVNGLPFSFAKIKKYLSGFGKSKAVNWFIDYIKFCRELDYDLSNEFVVFPKDLKAAHDDVAETAKLKQREEAVAKAALILPALHDIYDFSYKDLMITAPIHSAEEIITEGQTLHHCVGGYLASFANGNTTILFVRKKDAPETPFYTMEVVNGKVIQCRGKCNCKMTDEVLEAVEAFKREKLSKLAMAV